MKIDGGILIAVEGIDGAGKTTQAQMLAEHLRAAGIEVVTTKEPTTGPHGQRLRDSAKTGRLSAEEELETFIADRREHVADLIRPALAQGAVVIVDRYYLSTAAYQGARGLDPQMIIARNEEFAPKPDLFVLLKISPATAVERISTRDGTGNLFEDTDNLQRCATIFDWINHDRVVGIVGERSRDEIHADIMAALDSGPLFQRLCLKGYLPACEPYYCTFRIQGQCQYVQLPTLRPSPRISFDEVNAIADDPNLEPGQRIEKVLELLRRA